MEISEQFGHSLRKLRLERQLTQEQLAHVANMSVPYLSKLESGQSNPSLAMLVDLARALKAHPAELLQDLVIDEAPDPRRKRPSD